MTAPTAPTAHEVSPPPEPAKKRSGRGQRREL
jgi:hypothetical protein